MTATPPSYVPLAGRGVLRLSGPDRDSFLQGLISQDVRRLADGEALYGCLLTPQGKFLHDFFLLPEAGGESWLIEMDAGRLPDLKKRLDIYRLRADVSLADVSAAHTVFALLPAETPEEEAPEESAAATALAAALDLPARRGARSERAGGTIFMDPRLLALGARAVLPAAAAADPPFAAMGLVPGTEEALDRRRLTLGVPDGAQDLAPERATLIESNMNELGAIDWEKGCYMGQELTARTHYRGLDKKRLLPVCFDGPAPAPDSRITDSDGRPVGEMRGGMAGRGLALLRLDRLRAARAEGRGLFAGETEIHVRRPGWLDIDIDMDTNMDTSTGTGTDSPAEA